MPGSFDIGDSHCLGAALPRDVILNAKKIADLAGTHRMALMLPAGR